MKLLIAMIFGLLVGHPTFDVANTGQKCLKSVSSFNPVWSFEQQSPTSWRLKYGKVVGDPNTSGMCPNENYVIFAHLVGSLTPKAFDHACPYYFPLNLMPPPAMFFGTTDVKGNIYIDFDYNCITLAGGQAAFQGLIGGFEGGCFGPPFFMPEIRWTNLGTVYTKGTSPTYIP